MIAESTILKGIDTEKVERQFRYFKAKFHEKHKAEQTNETFKDAIGKEQTIVFTDKSTPYLNIADYIELHASERSDITTAKETLKRVHNTINSAKRSFVETYHKIKKKHL